MVKLLVKLIVVLAIVGALFAFFTRSPHDASTTRTAAPATAQNTAQDTAQQEALLKAEAERRIAADASGRRGFPGRMDSRFRNEFRDFEFAAVGDRSTILSMRQTKGNQAFTYRMQIWTDFLDTARSAGFQQVVVTDGTRATRTIDLTK